MEIDILGQEAYILRTSQLARSLLRNIQDRGQKLDQTGDHATTSQ